MESTDTTATDGVFRIVPAAMFPTTAEPVAYVEVDGRPQWLIREGTNLDEAVDALDRIASHLVRHGIWRLQRDDTAPPRLRHVS
jgi:hypothetical protein